MSSTDMVIKSDLTEKPAKRCRVEKQVKQVKQENARPQSGVLVIPSSERSTAPTETANVMVIPSLDIEGTRLSILANWRGYTPAKIVAIFFAEKVVRSRMIVLT